MDRTEDPRAYLGWSASRRADDPVNARLAAQLRQALAESSLKKGIDRAEARRAKGDADYQMLRAAKLDPDNDEIKKLRTEVAQMLQLAEQARPH
jgi:hypothetical protein